MSTYASMSNTGQSHPLIDHLRELCKARSDRQLSKLLGIDAPTISRVRLGKRPITAEFILKVHDSTDLPIKTIKALIPPHQA